MTDNWVSRERRVEARQVSWDSAEEIAVWCGGRVVTEKETDGRTMPGINFFSSVSNEIVRASEGDFVVKNPSGRFQKMSRFAFESEFIQVVSVEEVQQHLEEAPKSLDPRERWRTK